jgi:hypothetical protein
MHDLTTGRAAFRQSGLWGFSRRFWTTFVAGAGLLMFDAFETLGGLRVLSAPMPGHPGATIFYGESNPLSRAVIDVSPSLFVLEHFTLVLLLLIVFWSLTRPAFLSHCRTPSALVLIGVCDGPTLIRRILWSLPAGMFVMYLLLAIWNVGQFGLHLW